MRRTVPVAKAKLCVLLVLVALIAGGCRGCMKDSPFARWFGKAIGAGERPTGLESSVLPEPIRGKATRSVAELQPIYFAFDSAELLDPAKEQLQRNAQWLRTNEHVHVQLEGHCDERGTAEYNYALGQRRADAARAFLIEQGIDPGRLHTISYGAERPADPGHNEMAWARNRRVEFKIYGD